jgi:protein involved in polysaccharide export with SLBB domain
MAASAVGLVGLFAVPVFAAQADKPDPRPEPITGAPLDRNHHLGPGDVIEVVVAGVDKFGGTFRLFADGTFDHPIVGVVSAAGLTIQELTLRLQEGLRKELRRPMVTVLLREVYVAPKPETKIPRIVVLGAVGKKGERELPEPKPLRTLLAEVGPTEGADLSQVRVRYPDGSARTADFSRFNLTGETKDDVTIRGGEEIIVLERAAIAKPDPIRVEILGAVARPGTYEIEGASTILEAIQKAGGETDGAELTLVTVAGPAHPAPITIDVERYRKGNTDFKYLPRAGDTITIPQKPLKVYAYGEVPKPGEFFARKGEKVLDLFVRAGYPRQADAGNVNGPAFGSYGGAGAGVASQGGGADIEKSQIIRKGKDGKPVYLAINIRSIMKGKDEGNVVLEDGDVLFIPNKKTKRGVMYYLSALTTPLWLMRGGF